MSYFNQMPDVTRDQERSARALLAMDELINKWPQSEYVPDARQRVAVARDQLAAKEMDVGRFYLERRNYPGAVESLPRGADQVPDDASHRGSADAHHRGLHGHGHRARGADRGGRAWPQLPDSQWYKDAFKLLQTSGAEPRENQDSWISRAFRGFRRGVGI